MFSIFFELNFLYSDNQKKYHSRLVDKCIAVLEIQSAISLTSINLSCQKIAQKYAYIIETIVQKYAYIIETS